MMKLSTMWKVVKTVDETWACPLAEEVLRPWGFDEGSVRFFRASANFVCVFRREGRRHFLRFSEASERPRDAIEAEARLVAWLDRQGVPVAAPVPSGNGRLVETVETGLGRFYAIVFVGLEGSHLDAADCREAEFRAWGAALGRLHTVMKEYRDPSAAHRETWHDHLALALPYVSADEALHSEWLRLREWAGALPVSPDDFGLIHFDFESDNLCWNNGSISMLDFDDCTHHWYVADIAYALRDLFKEGVDLANPQFRAFMAGYEGEHSVNPDLLVQLPGFLRLHVMHQLGRISRSLDLPEGQDLPDWLKRLDTRLREIRESNRGSLLGK